MERYKVSRQELTSQSHQTTPQFLVDPCSAWMTELTKRLTSEKPCAKHELKHLKAL